MRKSEPINLLGETIGLDFERACKERDQAKAINAELLAALVRLSNEVYGSFPLFEPLARREMGNTNYNCLMQHAEDARALIAKVEGRAP